MILLVALLCSLTVSSATFALALRGERPAGERIGLGAKAPEEVARRPRALLSQFRNVRTVRRAELERSLPEAIDLLCVLITAGLNLNQALPRLAGRLPGAIGQEMARTCQQIDLGIPRRQALEDLAKRNQSAPLSRLVLAVVQAERYGTPLSKVLKVQAEEARTLRRQRAEELAHKAPIKLLFPLVFLILPAFLLLTVGPFALTMLK